MEIKQLKHITDYEMRAFEKLMSQLSDNLQISIENLNELAQSESSFLFVATENENIIGTTTLVTYNIPSGKKAWIEDVVVDESARGKGVGKKLVQFAIDYARAMNITKIDLTSSFERIAANELYQKMGFEKRNSNVYRLVVEKK